MGVVTVILVRFLTKDVPGRMNSALAISIMLFSFQWLDIVPALTKYGFGWGEISMAVKELAVLMNRKHLLDLLGIIAFLTVLLSGLVTSELLVLSTLQIKSMQKIRKQERHLAQLREEHLKTRSSREIQNLVHDLKRPLTTIVGLLDVLENNPNFPQNHKKHLNVAKDAALGMNQMISEILSSSSRRVITIEEIISYVMAQVSPLDFHKHVRVVLGEKCKGKTVEMNVVRFSRALVNLLDNASRAAKSIEREPQILLEARCNENLVIFIIKDNGPGFDEIPSSYAGSKWNSTGLGLAFTNEVILEHGGNISMDNAPAGGGIVRIHLPLNREGNH
jgi:signal transduction histidine kinase